MALVGGSAPLFGTATRLDAHALHLRGRADGLVGAAARVAWESSAAGAFRHQVDEVARGLVRAATGLEHAAAELRAHARTVQHVEQVVGAVGHTAEAAVGAVVHGVAHAIGLA